MAKKDENVKDVEKEEVKEGKKETKKTRADDGASKKEAVKKTTKAETKTTAKKAKKEKVKLSKEERKHSKKYREVAALVEREKYYTVEEAVELAQKTSTTKFDSSVEIHIRLGVNPAAQDQQVRGTVALPHGTGKTQRVAVICAPDKEKEAHDAGADLVGEKLITDIEKGKLDFDVLVASPDMMAKIGKLGKVLGTKGLMPNPKAGTVTPEVGKAVKELKAGRVEFKVDKSSIVHQVIGKASFDANKLEENYTTFVDALKHAKPSGVKGTYIRSISLATTMGPGIKIAI